MLLYVLVCNVGCSQESELTVGDEESFLSWWLANPFAQITWCFLTSGSWSMKCLPHTQSQEFRKRKKRRGLFSPGGQCPPTLSWPPPSSTEVPEASLGKMWERKCFSVTYVNGEDCLRTVSISPGDQQELVSRAAQETGWLQDWIAKGLQSLYLTCWEPAGCHHSNQASNRCRLAGSKKSL